MSDDGEDLQDAQQDAQEDLLDDVPSRKILLTFRSLNGTRASMQNTWAGQEITFQADQLPSLSEVQLLANISLLKKPNTNHMDIRAKVLYVHDPCVNFTQI